MSTTERSAAHGEALRRFKHLTEYALPARARTEHWPIHFDHCFKRICLDHAFADVWYKHLQRPAERHIESTALIRALQCAEALLTGTRALLDERNRASLGYRGKLAGTASHRKPARKRLA